MAFIGDDTGLIKKVKINCKRIESIKTIEYQQNKRSKRNNWEYTNPIKLGPEDNQTIIKYDTDLQFKLVNKYGEQVKDQGIKCLNWCSRNQFSYVRGK